MNTEFSIAGTTCPKSLRTACASSLLVLALSTVAQAQFTYSTNNGTITITGYIGSNATVTIPSRINGLLVTSIGRNAFLDNLKLTNVSISDGVTNIGQGAFYSCSNLTSVTIPASVTSIGDWPFYACANLTRITIPVGVTRIGDRAFQHCANLTGVYFKGNTPTFDPTAFYWATNATLFYLPGTTGWGPTFAGLPTALWQPQVQTADASFGVRTNQFGFTINWASGMVVVVDASTDLVNPVWSPLETVALTGDSAYFSDPQWKKYPGRYYRLRSP